MTGTSYQIEFMHSSVVKCLVCRKREHHEKLACRYKGLYGLLVSLTRHKLLLCVFFLRLVDLVTQCALQTKLWKKEQKGKVPVLS
jgi:hypothetical protein